MNDPFDFIEAKYKIANAGWEDVEGSFDCQERGCYKIVHEARYSDANELLTWTCPEGHISEIRKKL